MLIDASKYIWQRCSPEDISISESPLAVAFDPVLRLYRFSAEGFKGTISIFETESAAEPIYSGPLPYEPETPVACDSLFFAVEQEEGVAPVALHLLAESGVKKVVLTPFLNTTEGMTAISNSYNDDSTFTTAGLEGFQFNGIEASTLYLSSNHWIGFGVNAEQLKVLRRDGCSTAIYRQLGEAGPDLRFLKIRFEGYTVYSNRVESNRLIFELFLFSNNDMFLNVIKTPTSGNTGTSALICNNTTTALALSDGSGGGTQACFRPQDVEGRTWAVSYEPYAPDITESFAYLIRLGGTFYTQVEERLQELPVMALSAAAFLEYGFTEQPSAKLLAGLESPHICRWQTGDDPVLIRAKLKAYPYPQVLSATADMSHVSILGIKLMTAEYSGSVGVSYSLDNGQSWSEEVPLGDWLNTDQEELWNSLGEGRLLLLRFILHDNAALSRFKITYIN